MAGKSQLSCVSSVLAFVFTSKPLLPDLMEQNSLAGVKKDYRLSASEKTRTLHQRPMGLSTDLAIETQETLERPS